MARTDVTPKENFMCLNNDKLFAWHQLIPPTSIIDSKSCVTISILFYCDEHVKARTTTFLILSQLEEQSDGTGVSL